MGRTTIKEYYSECYGDYKLGWSTHKNLSFHHRYYDNVGKKHIGSVAKMNEVLANRARITQSDRVLDAGCGIGGSSIWLAAHNGCRVVGINIIESQLTIAREQTAQRGLFHLIEFIYGDFTNTGFDAESFDVVWALESTCYASDKYVFLQEAKRLLKPGGRLVVADGFLISETDDQDVKRCLSGWAISNINTIAQFMEYLYKLNFLNPLMQDITPNIIPSSRRIYRAALAYYPIGMVLRCLGIRSSIQSANVISALLQYKTLLRGLWKYYIITAMR